MEEKHGEKSQAREMNGRIEAMKTFYEKEPELAKAMFTKLGKAISGNNGIINENNNNTIGKHRGGNAAVALDISNDSAAHGNETIPEVRPMSGSISEGFGNFSVTFDAPNTTDNNGGVMMKFDPAPLQNQTLSNNANSGNSNANGNNVNAAPGGVKPLYVNPKQYHRIKIRREEREALKKRVNFVPKSKQQAFQYLSRHKHAVKRRRGPGGRFLTKEELAEMEANGELDGDNRSDEDNRKSRSHSESEGMFPRIDLERLKPVTDESEMPPLGN